MTPFPDCEIFDMPQRSDAWHEARRGILTASNFGPWLLAEKEVRLTIDEIKARLDSLGETYQAKGKKEDYVALLPDAESLKTYTEGAASARENAICQLIAERAFERDPELDKPEYISWEMERGTRLEPHAIAAFEGETGIKTKQVGFCRSKKGLFGCSPDGLIGDDSGIENKCPVRETHIRYRRAGEVPSEYLFQVHGSMAVTGAKSWHFQSWCPGLAPLRLLVQRDDFTERLLEALIVFSGQFERAWLDECAAVAESKGRRKAA